MNVGYWIKIGLGIVIVFAIAIRIFGEYKRSGLDASFIKGFIGEMKPKKAVEKNEEENSDTQDYADFMIASRLIEDCILDNKKITLKNRRLALNVFLKIKACYLEENK